MSLITEPNIDDRDGAYADLIAAHKGLDAEASAALNARLILILMNHVGDRAILRDAIDLALKAGSGGGPR